jgi:hypothetical protein
MRRRSRQRFVIPSRRKQVHRVGHPHRRRAANTGGRLRVDRTGRAVCE